MSLHIAHAVAITSYAALRLEFYVIPISGLVLAKGVQTTPQIHLSLRHMHMQEECK